MTSVQSPPVAIPKPYPYDLAISKQTSLRITMPSSSSVTTRSTSVFKALASFTDGDKENGDQPAASSSSGVRPVMSSSSSSTRQLDTPPVASAADDAAAGPAAADGPWETVPVGRRKTVKEKEKESESKRSGSNSRDWRERPNQSTTAKEKPEDVIAQRRSAVKPTITSAPTKKSTSAVVDAPSTAASGSVSRAPRASAAAGTGSGTKMAWGYVPSPSASGTHTPAASSETPPPAERAAQPSSTVTPVQAATPTSPSLNGTTLTATASVVDSMDAESMDTAVTSTAAKASDEGDSALWRVKTQQLEQAGQAEAANNEPKEARTDVAPPASPPTAVDAWVQSGAADAPAPAASPTHGATEQTAPKPPTQSAWGSFGPLRFGTLTPEEEPRPLPMGPGSTQPVKLVKKKKRSQVAAAGGQKTGEQGVLADATAWPDVATAAEVLKQQEEKKAQAKAKKEEEETPQAGGSKGKKKWTAIPAAELLAAVDEVVESNRRQARAEQLAKKKRRGSSVTSSPARPGRAPGAAAAAAAAAEPRKGRSGVSVNPEIRLPPQPQGSRRSSIAFVPAFGSVLPGSDGVSEINESVVGDDGASVPLSRQTSRQSRRSSPRKAQTQLSSPIGSQLQLEGAIAGGAPFGARHSNTAPLPQQPFPGASGAMPRPPRGRDARASFSGGRGGRGGGHGGGHGGGGGYRGGSGMPKGQMMNGWMGPPAEGYHVNGDVYAYPTGGAGGMFPLMPGFGYDAGLAGPSFMNMGMAARGGMAPPPTPVTAVQNLDALRYYLLGQVEFYFSMQNLAMDFFLRQQMDSEGWIDISTIASFNRVRSFTPESALVREVMLLSSLLEVREDKVRLARGQSKLWVLPNAKPSPFGPEDGSDGESTVSTGEAGPHKPGTIGLEGLGAGPASMRGFGVDSHLEEIAQMEHMTKMYEAFGVEDVTQATAMPRFDAREVESALMKGGARGLSSADSGHVEKLGAVGLGGGLQSATAAAHKGVRSASHGSANAPAQGTETVLGLGLSSGTETTNGDETIRMGKADTPRTSAGGDVEDRPTQQQQLGSGDLVISA